MAENANNPNSVCFSAVLRRLLCSGGSQTHPSDNIYEIERSDFQRKTEDFQARASPNLVARLMGLETLPEKNWVSRDKSPGSVTRSKSVNFMEYMLNYDDKENEEEEEGTLHRRVKTSVSFRELPCTKIDRRKHESFTIDFVKLEENCETELKFVKHEKGFQKLAQRKSEQSKNKETNKKQSEVKRFNKKVLRLKDEPRKERKNKSPVNYHKSQVNYNTSPVNYSKSPVIAAKIRRKQMNPKEEEPESSKTSPNSVIELKDEPRKECKTKSPVNHSKSPVNYNKSPVIAAKIRRKRMNPKEEEPESSSEGSNPSPSSVLELDLEKYQTHDDYSSPGDSESTRLDSVMKSTEDITKLVNFLAEMSEKEMKETNWLSNLDCCRFEDVEEDCKEFEQEVVDLVLDQLVDELVCNDYAVIQTVYI